MNKTKERLDHISKVSRARDERMRKAAEIKRQKITALIEQIESKSRTVFPDLFEIARSLVSHGYLLGNKPHWADAPEFCTNGISHQLGFYLESGNPISRAEGSMPIAFGRKGGGWIGIDFKINMQGKVESYDYDHIWCREVMDSYCSDLDEFCERFYSWVDSLK